MCENVNFNSGKPLNNQPQQPNANESVNTVNNEIDEAIKQSFNLGEKKNSHKKNLQEYINLSTEMPKEPSVFMRQADQNIEYLTMTYKDKQDMLKKLKEDVMKRSIERFDIS